MSLLFGSRPGTTPTHGWLISNRIIRKLAWAFIIQLLVLVVTISTITYAIRRDCNEPYRRTIKMFGYWLHVDAGSTKIGCTQP